MSDEYNTHFNKAYKNIEFVHGDANDIINQYKNKTNIFLFLDPPFLLTSSFYMSSKRDLKPLFDLLIEMKRLKSKILAVCGDNFLLLPFYEKYKIQIKFKTELYYRSSKARRHENIYVSNY